MSFNGSKVNQRGGLWALQTLSPLERVRMVPTAGERRPDWGRTRGPGVARVMAFAFCRAGICREGLLFWMDGCGPELPPF